MPGWVQSGYDEYAKRLPNEFHLELVEVPLGARHKNETPDRAIASEGEAMLKAIGQGDRVIVLEVKGKPWGTDQLARNLRDWQGSGDNFSLLIGGPDGLAQSCIARANMSCSLSALTLPHPLVRIILIEQLYRAWSINAGHPYHR